MIAQIERAHVIAGRQIGSGRLPVARGSEEAVQDDQGRPAGAAEVAVKELHAAAI